MTYIKEGPSRDALATAGNKIAAAEDAAVGFQPVNEDDLDGDSRDEAGIDESEIQRRARSTGTNELHCRYKLLRRVRA
jgi:hypothetical protein